mmetsp:Transcript_47636/g.152647  ORF Transcript_47636/g.152647 Transcript_47636/m.152647 type:complete len:205 (-) Transcript_47636:857-1471(-)
MADGQIRNPLPGGRKDVGADGGSKCRVGIGGAGRPMLAGIIGEASTPRWPDDVRELLGGDGQAGLEPLPLRAVLEARLHDHEAVGYGEKPFRVRGGIEDHGVEGVVNDHPLVIGAGEAHVGRSKEHPVRGPPRVNEEYHALILELKLPKGLHDRVRVAARFVRGRARREAIRLHEAGKFVGDHLPVDDVVQQPHLLPPELSHEP